MLIVEGHSRADVIEALKKDVYYKNGIWDVDGAEIIPFKLAFVRPV